MEIFSAMIGMSKEAACEAAGGKDDRMIPDENEIRENLTAAGCECSAEQLISCLRTGESRAAAKVLSDCRRQLVTKLHEDQRRIDRLDYLVYQMKL